MQCRYVFADIHGCGDVWNQVKLFIGNEPTVFLGDAADRGPDGFRIINEMIDMPNLIYLMGNHEKLFINAAREYKQNGLALQWDISLWFSNGGRSTYRAWRAEGCPMKIINRLDKLPLFYTQDNYDMCHSGCFQEQWKRKDEADLTWNRDHFQENWFTGRTLIHGHTAAFHISGEPERAAFYNGKIDLDIRTIECGTVAVYDIAKNIVIYIDRFGVKGDKVE